MKYLQQFGIIILVTFLAEGMKWALPFRIPASIYGLVLMLFLLKFHMISINMVKETGRFLVDIMPVMFIPAGVGLMTAWDSLKPVLIPIMIITVVTTFLVMVVTGLVTQRVLRAGKEREEQ